MENIKAILFDKDGTLLDFFDTFNSATSSVIDQLSGGNETIKRKVATLLGFDLETLIIADDSIIVAGSSFDLAALLLPVLEAPDTLELSRTIDRLYGEACNISVTVLPGVMEVLTILRAKRFLLGVATNDAEENARSQMRALQIDHLFNNIYGADSGFGGKPGPGMIRVFMKENDLGPDEVVMVGDSLHDIEAGKAAGVFTIGVLTGPETREELETKADLVLESVRDLPGVISS